MKAVSVLKRTAFGTGGLLLALVVVFIAINWHDQPASPAARKLEAALAARVVVSPAENGFVHLLGLAVPQDQDVIKTGTARFVWLAQAKFGQQAPSAYPDRIENVPSQPSAEFLHLHKACRDINRACESALSEDIKLTEAWVASGSWLSARYGTLLDTKGWHEALLVDIRRPLPTYGHAFEAQRLLFVQTWLLARRGDNSAIAVLLERDLMFWRRMHLASANLLTRAMAGAGIRRHFQSAGVVLRALSPERQLSAVPAQWHAEFSRSERAMLLALAGEYHLVKHALLLEWETDTPASYWKNFLTELGGLKRQDAANRYAEHAVAVAQTMDSDYAGVEQAAGRARTLVLKETNEPVISRFYNPVGRLAMDFAPELEKYGRASADLEALRRAALLAAQLRADRVSPSEVPTRLQSATLRNPYSGGPFAWNADTGQIDSGGIADTQNSRKGIEY